MNSCFSLFRKYRLINKGGGVLIAVRDHLLASAIDIETDIVIMWVQLKILQKNFVIGLCYRSPNFDCSFVSRLKDCLEKLFSVQSKCTIILFGELSFPGFDWVSDSINPSRKTSKKAVHFLMLSVLLLFYQIIKKPTRDDAALDIFVSTHTDYVGDVHHLGLFSDHSLFNIHLSISVPSPVM